MTFIIIILVIIVGVILYTKLKDSQDSTTAVSSTRNAETHKKSDYVTNNSFFNTYSSPVVEEHFRNLERINALYSELYNLGDFTSTRMEDLIVLCKRDIFIAEEFVNVFRLNHQEVPPTYGSFKRLAIIYEKRKEYSQAIEVCLQALKLGFTDKDMMYGRLARLYKKIDNQTEHERYSKLANK